MERAQAIDVLKNITSYYGIDSEVVSAIHIAISDMEYCAEVDKYGSELKMMIAHNEQYKAEKKKLDEEFAELEEYVKKMRGE